MLLTIDIETLPTTDPDVIAELAAGIKPPGNIKKQESIDAWLAENKDAALADEVAKTSFSGLYGRIACICYAIDDGEIYEVSDDDERALLENFYAHVLELTSIDAHHGFVESPITVVGHNVAGFDLPFIKHRSIIHQVKPPAALLKAMNAKPWDTCIADTMLMWSSDPHKRGSMDRLCKAFGIQGKDGFDGSMVAETWPIDRQKVIDYCKDDVERTRQIYLWETFQASKFEQEAAEQFSLIEQDRRAA